MGLPGEARILIITNDDVTKALYSSVLEYYRLDVSNFEEALQQVVRFVPHLVILDFDDDFQAKILRFLNQLHQSYDDHTRPLVLLIVPKDWFDQSLEILVDKYLASPVAPAHLLETLKNLLDRKIG
jgi:DNA-binding response OmpR family regulator